MLTGDIRNQIDRIWDAFWSGGISNPIEVIEQITYLLFIKRLDDLHTLEEAKATRLKRPIERRVFPEGRDDHPRSPRPFEDYRWSRFRHFAPAEMFTIVSEHVFPFLRNLGGERVQHVMKNMGKGNALAHLQITELAELPIPLPTITEQRAFTRRLEYIERQKSAQRASLAELDALFASLQHRAFRGEL